MPKVITTFMDANGVTHSSLEEATISDLTLLFDNPGIARQVWSMRDAILAVFEEYKALHEPLDKPVKLRGLQ